MSVEDRLTALLARDLPRDEDGVLDALGDAGPPPSTGRVQDLMLSRAVPLVYEGLWRPFWGRLAVGPLGPGLRDERRLARALLSLRAGDAVLDVACGSGGFTRDFARAVAPTGLAVGLDASPTMLARAARDTPDGRWGDVAYVRGDAEAMPFRDGAFDAACVFLALHLMRDPFAVLDELARVLAPGGRVAIMTTLQLRSAPLRALLAAGGRSSGQRIFERDEITRALTARGFGELHVRRTGVLQFVGATLRAGADRRTA